MTEEEKLAEEYEKSYLPLIMPLDDNVDYELSKSEIEKILKDVIEDAYLAGYDAGKPKWHDLRKDPNDLPSMGNWSLSKMVLFQTVSGAQMFGYYHHFVKAWYERETNIRLESKVVAWCEIPKYIE